MKTIPILVLGVFSLFLASCEKTVEKAAAAGDASFARSAFESLARGDTSVAPKIDWSTLVSLGQNVGAAYTVLPNSVDQERFVSAFITQFASSFRDSGGSAENFTNWRVTSHQDNKTEVAADSPGGVLQLTVTERDSIERVSVINMVK